MQIEEAKKFQSAFRFILHCAYKHKFGLLIFQLFASVWAIEAIVWPMICSSIAKVAEKNMNPNALLEIAVISIIAWILIDGMFRLMFITKATSVVPNLQYFSNKIIMNVIMRNRLDFFMKIHSSEMSTKIAQLAGAVSFVISQVIQVVIPTLLIITFTIFFTLKVHEHIGFVMILGVILHISIVIVLSPRLINLSDRYAKINGNMIGKISDIFYNIKNVKAFTATSHELRYIDKYMKMESGANKRAMLYGESIKLTMSVCNILLIGCLMWYVEYHLYIAHKISISDILFVSLMAGNLLFAIWTTSDVMILIITYFGIVKSHLEVLTSNINNIEDLSDITEKQSFPDNGIKFNGVCFAYKKRETIFNNLNVNIRPGEKIGLVGVSGAGKTTFAALISRYYEIDFGSIEIGGIDISKVSHSMLRSNIAIISQDCSMFNRTIMENILYGRLDATKDEMIAAAKMANADEFINDINEGYNSFISENGAKLSGGQRQRIALARAILKDAQILILDESTSALDTTTESVVRAAIQKISDNKTIITIAHRLETVIDMDRILVFSNGQIIEDGTHKALLKKDGYYAKMWSMKNIL